MQDAEQIKEIILYGAGTRCKRIMEKICLDDIEHIYIVDSNSEKWGSKLGNYNVLSPDIFLQKPEAFFYITFTEADSVLEVRKKLLEKYNCGENREIGYMELIGYMYKSHKGIRKKIIQFQTAYNEKHIIFDCYNGLGLGGIETWTMDIASNLYKNYGKRVRILSQDGGYDVPNDIRELVDSVGKNGVNQFGFEKDLDRILQYILYRLPCTVITSQAGWVLMAAGIIKKYCGDKVKIISVIHGGMEEIYRSYDIYKEDIDVYVGVSKDIQRDIIKRVLDTKPVYSMTCPFPCDKDIRRSYTKDKCKPIRIGYAGRMDGMEHSQKRMDLIIKLILTLYEKNINFVMELAGDGPVRVQMQQELMKCHAKEKIKFLGRIDRRYISNFWKKQDICINLADYEGRSISVIEAMGNGAVPIVTRTSGVQEDIKDGKNGYIVPIGDYKMMAEKIEYLESNRNCLPKMGILAHDLIYPKSLMEPHLNFWKTIIESEQNNA